MNRESLEAKFARMGARVKLAEATDRRRGRWRGQTPVTPVRLDVRTDARGEFFEVAHRGENPAEVIVLDVQPRARHLLLLVRDGAAKAKFLCGHDERHWFVAAVPESAPVGTVRQAMEALKPAEVVQAQGRLHLDAVTRNRRHNPAFHRQGEWFFLPASAVVIDPARVLHHEPLRRGNGGKPHWVEDLYRTGGETVYLSRQHPNGLTQAQYQALIAANPAARFWAWRVMRRGMEVYARGTVRHADHATIRLDGWHRVLMNTETQAQAMAHVAFLD